MFHEWQLYIASEEILKTGGDTVYTVAGSGTIPRARSALNEKFFVEKLL